MKSGTYITIVIIAGFLLIGYLFVTTPEKAPDQLPLILAAVGGLVAILNKQGETDAQVLANTKVTETTHEIVNSQRTQMVAELATLRRSIAALQQEKAVAAAEANQAESSEARIISAIGAKADADKNI